MSEHYEETFYIVPTYIRKLPGITLGYMDVYSQMFQFWNKGRECYLKNAQLAERTGLKERYVREALEFFESHNELKRVPVGRTRYLVQPEKKIKTDCVQPVGKKTRVALQCREGGTTVPGRVALQCQKSEDSSAVKATPTKGRSKLSFPLNKESLNKEYKYHDHEDDIPKKTMRAAELNADEKHVFESLTGMGMVDQLASNIAKKHSPSEINNIIEVGRYKGVKNLGAYVNKSIQNLN